MAKKAQKRDIHQLTVKVGNTHAWVKTISGMFNLPKEHIRFVAMLVALMERDGKKKVDADVRQQMMQIHGSKNMRQLYVITGRLKKVGIIDDKDRLHPLLDFVNGKDKLDKKTFTIRFERPETKESN